MIISVSGLSLRPALFIESLSNAYEKVFVLHKSSYLFTSGGIPVSRIKSVYFGAAVLLLPSLYTRDVDKSASRRCRHDAGVYVCVYIYILATQQLKCVGGGGGNYGH